MKFVSFEFLIFIVLLFIIYWSLKRKQQNFLILVASYVFYGFWDYRFLGLILFSSLLDYFLGIQLDKSKKKRKRKAILLVSLSANLGLLFIFKYFNFFSESFHDLIYNLSEYEVNSVTLNVILPVGISFYTFQTLSYTIDVYKRKLESSHDLVSFLSYVSFFPQLVAGPIERAVNFLPQFYVTRKFNYKQATDGLKQILWGVFKKVVVADNLGTYVDQLFYEPSNFTGSELILGVVYFSFQIYCDFSAYSDIAIGTAKLFGFNLMKNFNLPYFSRDIVEFWRRWHISLSTWFRDYVYIPLGGNQVKYRMKIFFNVSFVFILSALWHGANWTFIVWGSLHSILFLPYILTSKHRKHLNVVAENKMLPNIVELLQMISTFGLVSFCWIFFRAQTIGEAFLYVSGIFNSSLFSIPKKNGGLPIILILILIEWVSRKKDYPFQDWEKYIALRWISYIILIVLIIIFAGEEKEFIYFQF